MSKRDFYEVLGVEKSAEAGDIKKAYRRLAMKHHPDRNPDNAEAEEKFKEAKEAYEILSDEGKRSAYDQFGHAGVSGNGPGAGGFNAEGFGDVFGDVFGDIFGGGRGGGRGGRARSNAGADLRYTLGLNLEEAVKGTEVKIRVPSLQACEPCDGSGANKGSAVETCSTCGGVGQVHMKQGFFSVQQACPHCAGKGKIIKDPCRTCRGKGRVEKEKTLSVTIPAGVDSGDRIRLAGEGEAGMDGGPSGDLYVQVEVKEHKIFKRDGKHLYCEIPISFVDAALGGDIEVPTLDGKVELKVPAETQTDKMFRLRGKGVKQVRGGSVGDLMCQVVVETPVKLNKKQKDLLKEFQKSLENQGSKNSPKKESWFEGVKSFF